MEKNFNFERDLHRSDEIVLGVTDWKYAQALYAALCNNEWIPKDTMQLLKNEGLMVSWRYAGGMVSRLRGQGDYMDFYCSGSYDDGTPEGVVLDYIEKQLIMLDGTVHYDFVDIGTSDFDHSGTLHNDAKILLVEPLKCYYDTLPNNDNITKANYAISNFDGETEIYYVDPIDIEKNKLPLFLKGCNSIINKHNTALYELEKNKLEHLYKCESVNVITLASLFLKYDITSITNLKIDTEGHDHIILEQVLAFVKQEFQIDTIQFEYFVFGDYFNNVNDLNNLLEKFLPFGYSWHMLDKTNMKLYKNHIDINLG